MAGPSEIVPLDDESEADPEHAEVRPLLLKLDGRLLLPELEDVIEIDAAGIVVEKVGARVAS